MTEQRGLTRVPDVQEHGHKHVVHQVQGDAVCKQGVPHHQQVLQGELPAKQQTHPPAGTHTHTQVTHQVKYMRIPGLNIL